jgi:hypothetical protein
MKMRSWVVVASFLAVAACGSKKEAEKEAPKKAEPEAKAEGKPEPAPEAKPAAPEAKPAAPPSGLLAAADRPAAAVHAGALGLTAYTGATAPPAASTEASTACETACEHRTSCGLGEATGCVGECGALFDLGTLSAADLQGYAAASCDQVKQAEGQFQIAASCRHACAHRSECVAGASTKECLPDCAALVVASGKDPAEALHEYIEADCAAVTAYEPSLACLHGCTHVLGCGVAGDLGSCLSYCGDQLKQGATLAQIDEIAKADCETVKQSVKLPQPAPAASGGHLCTAEGVYTVCDGSSCDDHLSTSMGAGATDADAGYEAVAQCTSHMLNMVVIQQMNYRASVKQSCGVTRCQ